MSTSRSRRRAFTLFELLMVLALLMILFALMLPAIGKAKLSAARAQSQNNLKQIGLAVHNYHAAIGFLPPGCDDNHFSTAAHVLPFIEQDNLYKLIDFKKPVDDKANAQARQTVVRTFLNPMDEVRTVTMDAAPTNYLFCAGAKYPLKDNDGVFYLNSKVRFTDITDGTSNTIMTGETLKGDSMVRAVNMRRQHVALKKEALGELKEESGEKDWKDDKNIAADRCASWMDGRFLQGTFSGTRGLNDPRPDVTCGGEGGLSGLRSFTDGVNVGVCDGSVRYVKTPKVEIWRAMATRNGNEVLPNDF
jgi:Tfp pilus assembly protein PilE